MHFRWVGNPAACLLGAGVVGARRAVRAGRVAVVVPGRRCGAARAVQLVRQLCQHARTAGLCARTGSDNRILVGLTHTEPVTP